MVQFYGAPPMALLTVGAEALLLGPGLSAGPRPQCCRCPAGPAP